MAARPEAAVGAAGNGQVVERQRLIVLHHVDLLIETMESMTSNSYSPHKSGWCAILLDRPEKRGGNYSGTGICGAGVALTVTRTREEHVKHSAGV